MCQVGPDYSEDTRHLYDVFEKHYMDRGFATIKQNGFTRQLFKQQLLKVFPDVSYKEWGSPLDPGKKHGYIGIKLQTSPVQLPEATRRFVQECCVFDKTFRIKLTDLRDSFDKYCEDKFGIKYSKMRFYPEFRKQHPDLIEKCVTQSEKGFVGVTLRENYMV